MGQTNEAFGYVDTLSATEQSEFDPTVPTAGTTNRAVAGQTEGQGAGQITQQAGKVAEQVKGQVTSQLDQQKARTTSTLDSLSAALRDTGQRMHEQGQAPAATAADKVADQIERVSSYLSRRDVSALRADAENFARTRTPLFLAGAFALGWVGARFFKSSAPENDTADMGYRGNTEYYASQALPPEPRSESPYAY